MSSKYRFVRAALAAALVVLASSPADALTWTCEAIVRKGSADPALGTFAGKFGKKRHGGPAINSSGDVVFFATPSGGPRRLYLYPRVGAPVILASAGSPAPGGGSFTKFMQPSINDAGDVAFFGDLASGEGVFVDPAAGAMFKVAATGDPAPGGGAFDTFDGVARINASGDVAFLATVVGAPTGIFVYDGIAMTIASIARVGDATLDGREICSFVAPSVGLGGSLTAFQVGTKVSCANALETELIGIYRDTGLGIDRVALQGDPTPFLGTTYDDFVGDPDLNETDQVLFRATMIGSIKSTGLFLFDAGGPTTITVTHTGEAAAGVGGYLRSITEPNLSNGAQAGFRANLGNTAAKEGIFLYDGVDEVVVSRASAVPGPLFLPGSVYQKIYEEIGMSRSGTWVTYSATVKQPPGNGGAKIGLFPLRGSVNR